jgi:hypothetical protein
VKRLWSRLWTTRAGLMMTLAFQDRQIVHFRKLSEFEARRRKNLEEILCDVLHDPSQYALRKGTK